MPGKLGLRRPPAMHAASNLHPTVHALRAISDVLTLQAETAGARLSLCSIDEGVAVTYAGLLRQVRHLAGQLRALDIARGDRVAIVMPAGPEMAVTFLGVSAVAACAPLNPAYRRSDFEFYLDDLNPAAVVLPPGRTSPIVDAAEERGIRILNLDLASDASASLQLTDATSGKPIASSVEFAWSTPEDVALLLHTSGTTSRPKLVPLTHENLCASARQIARTLGLTSTDRCLSVMPLFHIHGLVGGLLSSLVSGGSVVCCPGFQADHFLDWCIRSEATWYTAVPTVHQSALEEARKAPDRATRVSLRFIRSSSAALAPSVLEAMERQWGVPVVEAYGMTEASHQIASNPLPPLVRKPGSVGRPAGPRVAVVDEHGVHLENGIRGEVVIRGESVTRGYAKNPAANQNGFRDGWFRTGDEGYFDADGYLFLTGRLKEMINRGGENIAPREIDDVLMRHGSVAQAVAFAVPHQTLGEDVVAAVVFRAGHSATEVELRQYVARYLPDFKVPSRILNVESIPKGATGKLQRIGLHEQLKSLLEVDYVPPQSEEETWVAHAFAKVLDQAQVGRNDNFFALGGDSLRAVRVAIDLASPLGQDLPVATLFEYPTPALLGSELQRLRIVDAELDDLARALDGVSLEELEQLLAGGGSDEASR